MFRHPARAVGNYSSGPAAAETLGTKSTGRCYQGDVYHVNHTERIILFTDQRSGRGFPDDEGGRVLADPAAGHLHHGGLRRGVPPQGGPVRSHRAGTQFNALKNVTKSLHVTVHETLI